MKQILNFRNFVVLAEVKTRLINLIITSMITLTKSIIEIRANFEF